MTPTYARHQGIYATSLPPGVLARLSIVILLTVLLHLAECGLQTLSHEVVRAKPADIFGCSVLGSEERPPVPKHVGQVIEPTAKMCFPATEPIPVLGVSVRHDGHMFLTRLIQSIDYPISNIVIAYNKDDPLVSRMVNAIYRDFANVTLVRFNRPQSCAEGWNAVMQAVPNAPWYLLPNNDVFFPPGQLQKLAHAFPSSDAEQALLYPLNINNIEYCVFAVKKSLIDRVGNFDENIYPAYWEDDDWEIRLSLLDPPVKAIEYHNIYYIHGFATDRGYETGQERQDVGPQLVKTTRSYPGWYDSTLLTQDYMKSKWGCMYPERRISTFHTDWCSFTRPFNHSQHPLSYWKFDHSFRQKKLELMFGRNAREYELSMKAEPAWEITKSAFRRR